MYEPRVKPLVFKAIPDMLDGSNECGYEVQILNDITEVATSVKYDNSSRYEDTGNLPDEYYNGTPRMEIFLDICSNIMNVVTIEIYNDEYMDSFEFIKMDGLYTCWMNRKEWFEFKYHSRKCGDRLNQIMKASRKMARKWAKQKTEVFAV